MMSTTLGQVAVRAEAAGMISRTEHIELAKVAAIDWTVIIKLLPTLAVFFPALAPFLPFITPIVNAILALINKVPNVVPTPPVVVPPDGTLPTPH